MYYTDKQRAILREVIASFPDVFGLRAWPDDVFRICEATSFFSTDEATEPTLYTERLDTRLGWVDWAKGTPLDLRRQITPATQAHLDRVANHKGDSP